MNMNYELVMTLSCWRHIMRYMLPTPTRPVSWEITTTTPPCLTASDKFINIIKAKAASWPPSCQGRMPRALSRSLSAAGSARWRLTAPSRESDVAESRAGAVRQEGEEMKGRGGGGGGGREGSRGGEERRGAALLFFFFLLFYSPGASDQQL